MIEPKVLSESAQQSEHKGRPAILYIVFGNIITTIAMVVTGGILGIAALGLSNANLGPNVFFVISILGIVVLPILVAFCWSLYYFYSTKNIMLPIHTKLIKAAVIFVFSLTLPALWILPGAMYSLSH